MIDDTARGMISVWMGTTTQSPQAFERYLDGMEASGSGCPAHRDFGCDFLDADFFIAYATAGHRPVPVETLVLEVGTHTPQTERAILARCHELGVVEGNALYFYDHCSFHEEQPGRFYNELRFIGSFANPRQAR
ncbi:hypothetical protein GLA29479_2211 [Lysobacter antibioticus]|jgi:hypothetical protein|uniref:Immunity protein 22 n=1 Tax=Lysobacter antibioticus TaxID=84531 RepID=A0A0S2DX23_LYSAN|nr:immunity 22 family protein [Lysobacter antibioticus]ALN63081.1 hypothetical protein GLA29479_2211 [Lysobacter antibioticus]ALN82388.1 hypothetical protein LA76x_4277 [Lysobacter antibioticus]